MKKNELKELYTELFNLYGYQGWWPLLDLDNRTPINITKSGSIKGYHPTDYSYPKTENQIFEICIGAIATQNTSWIQVEKALRNLLRMNALCLKGMKALSDAKLKEAIKPAGYFNQKAKKVRLFTKFFESLNGRTPTRDELLSLWGIGNETADSILLYAYKVPSFVVDTYTRRVLLAREIIGGKESYEQIKDMFESQIEKDIKIYQEYHALLVEEAKHLE